MLKHILFLVILAGSLQAQTDSSLWIPPEKEYLLEVLDDIYNLEFEEYEQKLAFYKQQHPERPEGPFAEVVAIWMRLLTDIYNPEFDDFFFNKIDSVIDYLDDFEKDNPYYPLANFYRSAANGFKAILYVTRESWFSAAIEGSKAVKGVKLAMDGKIPNPDARLGLGLYRYYVDVIPQRYPLLKPILLFYPDGDKDQGLEDLIYTTEQGIFAKVVASYMYSFILYTRENQYLKAYQIMKQLYVKYPNNPIFLSWTSGMALRIGRYAEAEKLLKIYERRIKQNREFYPDHKMRIVNYRYGLIERNRRNYDLALDYFKKGLEPVPEVISKGMLRYKVYCTLQMGYIYERNEQWEKARNSFEQVLDWKEFNRSHDFAKKHLENVERKEKQQSSEN